MCRVDDRQNKAPSGDSVGGLAPIQCHCIGPELEPWSKPAPVLSVYLVTRSPVPMRLQGLIGPAVYRALEPAAPAVADLALDLVSWQTGEPARAAGVTIGPDHGYLVIAAYRGSPGGWAWAVRIMPIRYARLTCHPRFSFPGRRVG